MLEGLLTVLEPSNLLLILLASIAGIAIGALPGLTATMSLALLVPFTFVMSPAAALIALGAMWTGSLYGDAIPATLVNIPGTPSAVVTGMDGFPMTQQGKGQAALTAASFSSMVGSLAGGVVLLLLTAPFATFALRFGPPEYFWVSVFALTLIGAFSRSLIKGAAGASIGVMIAAIGIAPIGGDSRFTFGFYQLQGGLPTVTALIALFAMPQLFRMIEERRGGHNEVVSVQYRRGVLYETVREILGYPIMLLRSCLIGIGIGVLPGVGPPVASMVAYSETVRWTKDKSRFGKGDVRGVVAAESANNAAGAASLIPLLSLGVPGSAPAAVIFGALLLHGLRPGAQLFSTRADVTYGFIWSMIVAGVATFLIGGFISRYLARIVNLSTSILFPSILVLCVVGAYATRNNLFDVYLLLIVGFCSYLLGKIGIGPAPIALGIILGPIIERAFVTTVALSGATSVAEAFFLRPLSLVFIVATVVTVTWVIRGSRSRGEESVVEAVD